MEICYKPPPAWQADERNKNLALRVEDTDSGDSFLVYGRGILHLGILIETMRREGYELTIWAATGFGKNILMVQKMNLYETLVVDVPAGICQQGDWSCYTPQRWNACDGNKGEMQHLEFEIPSKRVYRYTHTNAYTNSRWSCNCTPFIDYKPWKGSIPGRNNGVLLSKLAGTTTAYSIDKLQDRGSFFVDPGEEVYAFGSNRWTYKTWWPCSECHWRKEAHQYACKQ